jgi:hypothetical protein
MTVSGRMTHGGVPVLFTQGNPRAVKWVRDRTNYRLNKTLNERKVVLSQNRVSIYSLPSVTTEPEGLSRSEGGIDVSMSGDILTSRASVK